MAAAQQQLTARFAPRRTAVAVVTAVAIVGCGANAPAPTTAPGATDRTAMPRPAVDYVHRTFHRLPRSCARGRADRRQLDATTSRFLELYGRYPPSRFELRIDDESGTMLSVLLILRDELSRCSPRHAARIDPALPQSVRRALRPLRLRGG